MFEKHAAPDLDCDGGLSWLDVIPGTVVQQVFVVMNVGDPGSELDWEIVEWPDWGVWTITPLSGLDLTPEYGDLIINVEVIAPGDPLSEFDGEIKIVNIQNPDDFCIIESVLITPRNLPKQNYLLSFILQSSLMELLKNMFPLIFLF